METIGLGGYCNLLRRKSDLRRLGDLDYWDDVEDEAAEMEVEEVEAQHSMEDEIDWAKEGEELAEAQVEPHLVGVVDKSRQAKGRRAMTWRVNQMRGKGPGWKPGAMALTSKAVIKQTKAATKQVIQAKKPAEKKPAETKPAEKRPLEKPKKLAEAKKPAETKKPAEPKKPAKPKKPPEPKHPPPPRPPWPKAMPSMPMASAPPKAMPITRMPPAPPKPPTPPKPPVPSNVLLPPPPPPSPRHGKVAAMEMRHGTVPKGSMSDGRGGWYLPNQQGFLDPQGVYHEYLGFSGHKCKSLKHVPCCE